MKLLVCLAFYYVKGNVPFLRKVLNNILDNYHYDTHVIVDTNTPDAENQLKTDYPTVEFIAHRIAHPYHLTWIHREHMMIGINDYDLVMYSEDDVLVPFPTLLDYLEKLKTMWPTYIPALRRVEWSEKHQEFVALDVIAPQKVSETEIVHHNGKKYFVPTHPYSAFWCLPTKLLQKTINPFTFLVRNEYREHASAYLLGPPPTHKHDPSYRETKFLNKIPLFEIDNGQISGKCLIYHVPNKYADVPRNDIQTVPVKDYLQL